ncbi:hypothetical protein AURDEDRAFT_127119 [Auricularia subglabra TFB-10046 SS5]|uniref:Uncharacterized protein n=1 Tax=Auricularia subglabra (strain TFB-10046 / SS5) TaxID=717982 RepID=J0D2R9_AURST|nr:hypothetical protein AURDEDRAFT_127119 [Auricularia subglabra TFB-10046 SS5]
MSNTDSDLPAKGDVLVDDADPSFSYFPAEAWTTRSQQPWIHSAGTFHLTRSKSAQITFTFNGTRVWLYGDKNVDHRYFRATVDNGMETVLSTYGDTWTSKQLLYTSPELKPGPHVLFATNLAADSAFGVDYIMYRPISLELTPGSTGIVAPTSKTKTLSTCAESAMHQARRTGESHWQLIVTTVFSFMGVLCAASALLFLWSRRRRSRAASLHPLPLPLPPAHPGDEVRIAKLGLVKGTGKGE